MEKNSFADYYPRPAYEYSDVLLEEMYDYNGEEWYYGIRVCIDEDYEVIELNQQGPSEDMEDEHNHGAAGSRTP